MYVYEKCNFIFDIGITATSGIVWYFLWTLQLIENELNNNTHNRSTVFSWGDRVSNVFETLLIFTGILV